MAILSPRWQSVKMSAASDTVIVQPFPPDSVLSCSWIEETFPMISTRPVNIFSLLRLKREAPREVSCRFVYEQSRFPGLLNKHLSSNHFSDRIQELGGELLFPKEFLPLWTKNICSISLNCLYYTFKSLTSAQTKFETAEQLSLSFSMHDLVELRYNLCDAELKDRTLTICIN